MVVIGTDCPDITPELLERAFQKLTQADVVFGPAADGGYYLLGLRRMVPDLFTDIAWGSDRVLEESARRAETLALEVAMLETLADVDRPEDLPVWERARAAANVPASEYISVVIPTLNEAECLSQSLYPLNEAPNVEAIVVDGGSSDATVELAHRAGCRVVHSPPGRARQMNRGAGAATGAILLFLHADTVLPAGFEEHVRRALRQPGVCAGAFRMRIAGPGRALRWIERGVNLRSRLLQMPYGDQGLFMTAEVFHTLGGFPDLAIMDDYELVRRLRRLGRIALLPVSATTSGRRWQALGAWRTTWINQKVIAGYLLGVPPERLLRWYRGEDRQPGSTNPSTAAQAKVDRPRR